MTLHTSLILGVEGCRGCKEEKEIIMNLNTKKQPFYICTEQNTKKRILCETMNLHFILTVFSKSIYAGSPFYFWVALILRKFFISSS